MDGYQVAKSLRKNPENEQSVNELRLAHYAVAVDVTDHQQAVEIMNLAHPHGGHGFSYFGTWVSEQLSG